MESFFGVGVVGSKREESWREGEAFICGSRSDTPADESHRLYHDRDLK